MDPRPRSSRWVEALLAAAMAALLLAALVPRLVQIRRAPGERALHAARTDFLSSLGAVHGAWVLNGGASLRLEWRGGVIHLNEDGWPTLDADLPEQDTARELYARITGRPLPDGFSASEERRGAGHVVTFALRLPGGGAFSYDTHTGRVYEP